jgi:anaerobic ribonucleoside-triphosphate reductase
MPNNQQNKKCTAPVETYSRVVGFFRPVQHWNKGKQQEFAERKTFAVDK